MSAQCLVCLKAEVFCASSWRVQPSPLRKAVRRLPCALPHGDGSASSRESGHRVLEFISDQLEASLLLRPIEIRVRAQVDVEYDTFVCRIQYRPKCEMVPCTTALFSSAVPFVRLLEANFGTSFRLSISP